VPRLLSYQSQGINGTAGAVTDWEDNLTSVTFSRENNVVSQYRTDPYFSTEDPIVLDRWIGRNARYPNCQVPAGQPCSTTLVPVDIDHPSGGRTKGLRLVECLDQTYTSPVGLTQFFPAVAAGPAVEVGSPYDRMEITLFSQRLYNDFQVMLTKASSKGVTSVYSTCALQGTCVYYQTYTISGTTVTATTPTNRYAPPNQAVNCPPNAGSPCLTINRNFIASKQLQQVVAHEIGHGVSLIPKIQITTYGPHYAPATGDILDQRVVAKDSSKLNGLLYSIPTVFGPKSDACFQIRGKSATGTNTSCQ
jgi:hypothetical protein